MCSTLDVFFSRYMIFWIIYFCLSFSLFPACRSCTTHTHTGGPSQQQPAQRARTGCLPWTHPGRLVSQTGPHNPHLVAQICSTQIRAVYQSRHTLCFFHLQSPDPLSSFHRNKLTLKSFQHPLGHYSMTHRNDTSTWCTSTLFTHTKIRSKYFSNQF